MRLYKLDDRGISLAITAIFLSVILIFIACVIDIATYFITKIRLNNIADAAASAGAEVMNDFIFEHAEIQRKLRIRLPIEHHSDQYYLSQQDRIGILTGRYQLESKILDVQQTIYDSININAQNSHLELAPDTNRISYPNIGFTFLDCYQTKRIPFKVKVSKDITTLIGKRTITAESFNSVLLCPIDAREIL